MKNVYINENQHKILRSVVKSQTCKEHIDIIVKKLNDSETPQEAKNYINNTVNKLIESGFLNRTPNSVLLEKGELFDESFNTYVGKHHQTSLNFINNILTISNEGISKNIKKQMHSEFEKSLNFNK